MCRNPKKSIGHPILWRGASCLDFTGRYCHCLLHNKPKAQSIIEFFTSKVISVIQFKWVVLSVGWVSRLVRSHQSYSYHPPGWVEMDRVGAIRKHEKARPQTTTASDWDPTRNWVFLLDQLNKWGSIQAWFDIALSSSSQKCLMLPVPFPRDQWGLRTLRFCWVRNDSTNAQNRTKTNYTYRNIFVSNVKVSRRRPGLPAFPVCFQIQLAPPMSPDV